MPSSSEGKRVCSPTRLAATWSTEMPTLDVGAVGLARLAAGEERGHGAGVVAGAVAVGRALSQGQAGQDERSSLNGVERLEGGGQLEVRRPRPSGVQSAMCTPLGT